MAYSKNKLNKIMKLQVDISIFVTHLINETKERELMELTIIKLWAMMHLKYSIISLLMRSYIIYAW